MGLPRWHRGKESTCRCIDARDTGSIPGSGRSPGVENRNPFQYCCLKISIGRGDWWATVHRVAKSWDTTEHTHSMYLIYPAFFEALVTSWIVSVPYLSPLLPASYTRAWILSVSFLNPQELELCHGKHSINIC